MTRFDFKKWVTEHKHGKKVLNEAPATCAQLMSPADALIYCHEFAECVNGTSNNNPLVYTFGLQSPATPGNFYDTICPNGCSNGDAVAASNGTIYMYVGINANADTQAIGPVTFQGPAYCGPCTNCCCKELGAGLSEQVMDIEPGLDLVGRDRKSDGPPRDNRTPPAFVGGCKTGTSFDPDPLAQDPITGACDCSSTSPYGSSPVLSTPNTNPGGSC